MSDGIACMWMRGGTSKGGYFLASDLPNDPAKRDKLLLSVMGSPDARQIDGMGGADPLTSKVAVVSPSKRADVDVDYLFLQVSVDQPIVSDAQNCGNILAGVGPFAIERGLVTPSDPETKVRIYMQNTGQIAVARVSTSDGHVVYAGDAQIDGVPGTAAAIPITFKDTAGSTCGALFPTGNRMDQINGINVTLIDNGMPCVLIHAMDFEITGTEDPDILEANASLRSQLEKIRLTAGQMMNLDDVAAKTVPKMTLISAPQNGGAITTRTFIPHRCHKSIGVLGAVSVATSCLMPGTVAYELADIELTEKTLVTIEHPSGQMTIVGQVADKVVTRADVLRTARKLMDGSIFAK